MKFITTESSKKRNAPYSPGVIHNGILYVSGQLALDPATGKVAKGGVREHARQALANMDEVLQHAKKTGVLIEINENSLAAQDGTAAQCCRVAERCAELNVPISLGTDAHLSYRVGRFPCALAMLDKIGFPEELVASRTKESFLSALSNAGLSIH